VTRAQLEHVIRAAAAVTGEDEIVIIGSQAILGAHPDAPGELHQRPKVKRMKSSVLLPMISAALPLVACGAITGLTGGQTTSSTGSGGQTTGSIGSGGQTTSSIGSGGQTTGSTGSGGQTTSSGSTTASSGSVTSSSSNTGGAGGTSSQCGVAQGGGPAYTGDAGILLLQAFGGPSGEVAAQVPIVEPGVGQELTCGSPQDAGACQLTTCQVGGIGSPGFGWGDFGPIVASVGSTTEPLTYCEIGYPTVDFPPSVTLGTGGTMMFHGGGSNGVPPFDVCIMIPGLAVITSPVPTTDGGTVVVDTSQDLAITWEPIPIGQFQFQLTQLTEPGQHQQTSVACAFDGASGAGVIPQVLLSPLTAMSSTASTYASWSSEFQATAVVDGLTIMTQGFQNSPGVLRSFSVTLQ
jgi:hypothetical protein